MKAQDLRIGNYVMAPLGEIMRIDQIGHLDFPDYIHAMNETEFGQNGFEGIPLTPEILEKCGGHISDNGDNWKNPEYEIWVFRGMLVGGLKGKFYLYNNCEDDYYSWYSPEITHLHQFQNLYYCLCGKELEVKL